MIEALNITSEQQYQEILENTQKIMKKGSDNITEHEADQIEVNAIALSNYEKLHYPLPMPTTIAGMIRIKMLEMQLTQATLATKLGLGASKLSEILKGKRAPDVPFLKAAYEQLNISADFLLKTV